MIPLNSLTRLTKCNKGEFIMGMLLELLELMNPIFIFFQHSFSYVGGIILLMILIEKIRTHFSAKHRNTRQ